MKDKDGFTIKCKKSDWKIIDERDNHDFVCTHFGGGITVCHICYADEYCRLYEPEVMNKAGEVIENSGFKKTV